MSMLLPAYAPPPIMMASMMPKTMMSATGKKMPQRMIIAVHQNNLPMFTSCDYP